MLHRFFIAGLAAVGLLSFGLATPTSALSAKKFMKVVNADADKTISKGELDAYARKRFGELETDHDKTLDDKELKGRLSKAGMTMADADKDKSVDEAEFVGYADKLFGEANAKGDDTLSAKELKSAAGRKLINLLK